MAYSNEGKAMTLTLLLSGKSYREIGEVTGITANTLMRRDFKCRERPR